MCIYQKLWGWDVEPYSYDISFQMIIYAVTLELLGT